MVAIQETTAFQQPGLVDEPSRRRVSDVMPSSYSRSIQAAATGSRVSKTRFVLFVSVGDWG